MPIYKRCSRCGNRIPSGTKCGCYEADRNNDYDHNRRDQKSKAFYNSVDWIRTKQRILEKDNMDVYVFMTEGRIIPADTVHHIIPLRDDWTKRLKAGNLMSLNAATHSTIERMYKKDKPEMINMLQKMLTEFRKMTDRGAV